MKPAFSGVRPTRPWFSREFYAPLHRVLDDQPVRAAGMGGARGTPRGVELFQQRFGGSMRDIISPIQSIEGHMVLLERAIAENDVSKALASSRPRGTKNGRHRGRQSHRGNPAS